MSLHLIDRLRPSALEARSAEARPDHGATCTSAEVGSANREFDVSPRLLLICAYAVVVGFAASVSAVLLIRLMGLLTNLIYYSRVATSLVTPDGRQPFWIVVLAPVVGGLFVGLIARFGDAGVRGHGLPDALGTIVQRDALVSLRVALFKPLASVISIGTGGPFGAEGPVIASGGALGSLLAQALRVDVSERTTLLVCGSAAGTCAALGAPFASLIFAIEALLLELKLRSLVPVATAVAVAMCVHNQLIGSASEFFLPPVERIPNLEFALGAALVLGLACGLVSVGLTYEIRVLERAYVRTRIPWACWPALAGVVVGVGGLLAPQATGVGYDVVTKQLEGSTPERIALTILVVKLVIWPVALASGASGGVLAPVLVIGACCGTVVSSMVPVGDGGLLVLVCLAGMIAGLLRTPLSGALFATELTGRWSDLLPVVVAALAAYALASATARWSLLTGELASWGDGVRRDLSRDTWASTPVGRVMEPLPIQFLAAHSALDAWQALTCSDVCTQHRAGHPHLSRQVYFPVISADGRHLGVVTRAALAAELIGCADQSSGQAVELARLAVPAASTQVRISSTTSLRRAFVTMAEHGEQSALVWEMSRTEQRVVGVIDLSHLNATAM